MNIKLIAFDLDGTFLDDRKNIPPENLRALEYAAEKGAVIVPATGRIYPGIPEKIRKLPFIRYFITANGATVYDAAENKVPYRAEIPAELALRIMDYADTLPVTYDCYKDNQGYMTKSMFDCLEEYVSVPEMLPYIQNMRITVDSLPEMLRSSGESIQKMQLYLKDSSLKPRLIEDLKQRFPEAAISTSLPFNIEINCTAADKGIALTALCEHLSIPIEGSMAFGDGTNDIALISAAGVGISMANASDEVKQAADHITDSNNDAGVAKAIWRFMA